jgi:hypothetical protein
MRTNQLSVIIEQYSRASSAKPYVKHSIYADANNFFEAICSAYNESVLELGRKEGILTKGPRSTRTVVSIKVFLARFDEKQGWVDWYKDKEFTSDLLDPYKALSEAFNKVLFHTQKFRNLPIFGRKEHHVTKGYSNDYPIKIVSAYAGTGKSTLANKYPDKFADFSIMPYKYDIPEGETISEGDKASHDYELKPFWQEQYVEELLKHIAEYPDKVYLIPSDMRVLYELRKLDINYYICYPIRKARETYKERFVQRGNSDDFLYVFIDGWDARISALEEDQYGVHIIMQPEQYLEDVLDKMLGR